METSADALHSPQAVLDDVRLVFAARAVATRRIVGNGRLVRHSAGVGNRHGAQYAVKWLRFVNVAKSKKPALANVTDQAAKSNTSWFHAAWRRVAKIVDMGPRRRMGKLLGSAGILSRCAVVRATRYALRSASYSVAGCSMSRAACLLVSLVAESFVTCKQ